MQVVDVCQEATDIDLTGWKVRIEGNGVGAKHQTSTSDVPTFLITSFNHIGVAFSNAFDTTKGLEVRISTHYVQGV